MAIIAATEESSLLAAAGAVLNTNSSDSEIDKGVGRRAHSDENEIATGFELPAPAGKAAARGAAALSLGTSSASQFRMADDELAKPKLADVWASSRAAAPAAGSSSA